MLTTFTLARATARHAPGILACLERAFEPVRDCYTKEAWQNTVISPGALEERMRTMVAFVALDDRDEVVGTVACQAMGEEGHLRGMAVLPERHGGGVAQALLAAAEDELRSRGCRRVTLDTTEPLKRAIRFYTRNGYVATGRVTDFFDMPLYEYAKGL